MEIRQPAALNRYVDSTIPLTWEVRWRWLALVWPLSFVGGLFLLEQVAFTRWARGEPLQTILPMIPVLLLGVPVGFFLFFELVTRLAHQQARVLKLGPKRVTITHTKQPVVPWDRIAAWRLKPIAGEPSLRELRLTYRLGKKPKPERSFSIVLSGAEQEREFLEQLQKHTNEGRNRAPVTQAQAVENHEAACGSRRASVTRTILPFVIGLCCFVHGMPLLTVSVFAGDGDGDPDQGRGHGDGRVSSSRTELTPEQRDRVRAASEALFGNGPRMRLNMAYTGGVLTAVGLGLMFGFRPRPARNPEHDPLA